jgi:hypothetical protein
VKSKDYADVVAVMVVKSPETPNATVRVNITLPQKKPSPKSTAKLPKKACPVQVFW